MITDWFKKKAKETIEEVKALDNSLDEGSQKEDKIELKKEDEWIWVDGYKGTDKDVKCNGYQFKVGEKYIHEGNVVECKSGFHFCLNPEDILSYYEFNFQNRYFKVRALVKKDDYENYKNKLVSKEIEIIYELSDEECFKLCKAQKEYTTFASSGFYFHEKKIIGYKYIETIDDYFECKKSGDYEAIKTRKFIEKLKATNVYSEIFINWFIIIEKHTEGMFEKALALAAEDMSHDMRMVLLLTQ